MMNIVTKVMVEFTDEEYQTLLKAQHIWESIAQNLDNNNALTENHEWIFDDMNDKFAWLLDKMESGFEIVEEDD